MKLQTVLVFISGILISCNFAESEKNANTVLCSGTYIFLITDSCNRPIDVKSQYDSLTSNQYLPDSSGRSYSVRFSMKSDSVFIKGDSVIGVLDKKNTTTKTYSLINSFAGGSFVVWFDKFPMRATYTLYGSGLPIAWSERGLLVHQNRHPLYQP